ncbi:MAG: hypothetical protein U9O64_07960 [Campylobacterota bacterium]|nr:hypothetical protein [Campylobacterota bacterium]
MNLKKITYFCIMVFLLHACASKQYVRQNSAFILFKTPTFKYADMGFIYENEEAVKAEIYGSGQALMSLEISRDSVCMSLLACMSKKRFNQEVLSKVYPDDILDDIFRGKVIFEGRGLEKNSNGFTQQIRKENKYNIEYSVLNNEVIFHDTINSIRIIIKEQ